MKYIEIKDSKWHDITKELPAITSIINDNEEKQN